jgi:hypothetical protein
MAKMGIGIPFIFVLFLVVVTVLNLFGSGPISLNVHTGKVDLTPLGGDWKTVCIIGPYATNEMAKDLTGHAVDIVTQSEISSSDGIALLITIDAKDRTTLFDVSRKNSDFTSLSGTCWPKVTEFRVPTVGWPVVFNP